MRTRRISLPVFLMAVFLSVLIGFSSAMCLNDAFDLEVPVLPLLAVSVTAAVLAALSALLMRSWPVIVLTAVVCGGMLFWKRQAFADSLQTVVYTVSRYFSMAFSAVRVVGEPAGDPVWVLSAVALVLTWLVAWITGREGGTLLIFLAVLPVLVLVLLVVDLAPVLWLIVLTGGLLIVMISRGMRERNGEDSSIIGWWLVLPVITLLCAVTVLWPPADYVRADWSQMLQELTQTGTEAVAAVEKIQQTVTSSQPRWSRELKTVDLARLGPKAMTGRSVLQYRTDGTLRYLRGVSLAVYEDNAWNALPTQTYEGYGLVEEPLLTSAVMVNRLEIETENRSPQLYTAYYMGSVPEHGVLVDDGYIQNADRVTAYTLLYEPQLQYPVGTGGEADRLAEEIYTQVPESVLPALTELLWEQGLLDGSPQEITAFVETVGVYDLNTPGLPAGEDFVLYFLLESHRGYCVHFASAAVLLLRTAGIPARYVTGYAVDGPVDQWNRVTEDDAHAWVEYYTPGIGWRPLDPTPAGGQVQTPTEQDPSVTEQVPADPESDIKEPEQRQEPEMEPQAAVRNRKVSVAWLVVLPGLVLLVMVRRWAALRYRRKRCRKGHPNRRTMAYWRWLVQLTRAGGSAPEEELICLAEKARFSQHTMEEWELDMMRQAVERRIQELKTAPSGKRLWHRYGLLLY